MAKTDETWIAWATRLAAAAAHAERLAGPPATCSCHSGGVSPHTPRGARACRLRAKAQHQLRAWYEGSRWRGSRTAPGDYPELSRSLRGY